MIAQPQPRIAVFSDIADFCKSRGTRHPLSAILVLVCCALVCGASIMASATPSCLWTTPQHFSTGEGACEDSDVMLSGHK